MKTKYAVSLVFTKQNPEGLNIHNCLRIVDAETKEEAFGLSYKDCGDVLTTHQLSFHTCVVTQPPSELSELCTWIKKQFDDDGLEQMGVREEVIYNEVSKHLSK